MEETYIRILIDSLKKKKELLIGLSEQTGKQEALLNAEELDIDAFNVLVENKAKLIEALDKMDAGFDDVYARVREVLPEKKEQYRDLVTELQALITEVSELGVKISGMEERNRAKMVIRLSESRQAIREFKVGKSTAAAYYRNMAGRHQEGDSYFVDRKK